jgi:hypothetical protein
MADLSYSKPKGGNPGKRNLYHGEREMFATTPWVSSNEEIVIDFATASVRENASIEKRNRRNRFVYRTVLGE